MITVGKEQYMEMLRLKEAILKLSEGERREILDHISGRRLMTGERGIQLHNKLREIMKDVCIVQTV